MNNYKERYRAVKFPHDEQKHDHIIEWWYFNGNLRNKKGHPFSFMHTLFAAKPKQVNIPFLKSIPLKTLYFSHYLLTNNERHDFKEKINPVCFVDANSFTKPLLWVHYDNTCLIEENKLFEYHLVNDYIDLYLRQVKSPLLVNKKGFLDLEIKTTYYYSLTHLETRGLIKIDNSWEEVSGLSWMDHQWAQTPLTNDDKWTWFSIQLENNVEAVIFIYGDEIKTYHASLINDHNKTFITDNVLIREKGKRFVSKQTGAAYNLEYEIYLPDFNLILDIWPYNRNQEMIFGTINYWEGGIAVSGKFEGKKIKGRGFMELVGSPIKKGLTNIYLQQFGKKYLTKGLSGLSQDILSKFKAYQ